MRGNFYIQSALQVEVALHDITSLTDVMPVESVTFEKSKKGHCNCSSPAKLHLLQMIPFMMIMVMLHSRVFCVVFHFHSQLWLTAEYRLLNVIATNGNESTTKERVIGI